MTITKEKVYDNLKREIKNIKDLQFKCSKDERTLEEQDNFRTPLSIELIKEVKILLSWGGGEDGYKLRFKDKDLISGVYYMANWGEYEEIELNEDELNLIFDVYLYGEFPEGLK